MTEVQGDVQDGDEVVSGDVVPGDEDNRSSEDIAREKQAADTEVKTDAPDPTGALPEQMAAKQAANAMGDQDAVNLAGPRYPEGADTPTAANVRRYPELFSQEVIDSFDQELPRTAHEEALHDGTIATSAPALDSDNDEVVSTHVTSDEDE